jgi:hypothetical protein
MNFIFLKITYRLSKYRGKYLFMNVFVIYYLLIVYEWNEWKFYEYLAICFPHRIFQSNYQDVVVRNLKKKMVFQSHFIGGI